MVCRLKNEFDPEADPHSDRSSVTGPHLAHLHDVSLRTIQRMVKSGSLTQQPDGRFNRATAIDEMVAHKMSILPKRTAAQERLDLRRTELLQRRLHREALELISMPEVLATFDFVTGALAIGFDEIAEATIAIAADPDRATAACGNARTGMIERFEKHRQTLQTGKDEL